MSNIACQICGKSVEEKDYVRLDGSHPAHRECCEKRGRLYRTPTVKLTDVYRMILDWDRPCPKCDAEGTILIKSDNPELPTFHFCGCGYPTFEITQDNVGEVPSFSQAFFEAQS